MLLLWHSRAARQSLLMSAQRLLLAVDTGRITKNSVLGQRRWTSSPRSTGQVQSSHSLALPDALGVVLQQDNSAFQWWPRSVVSGKPPGCWSASVPFRKWTAVRGRSPISEVRGGTWLCRAGSSYTETERDARMGGRVVGAAHTGHSAVCGWRHTAALWPWHVSGGSVSGWGGLWPDHVSWSSTCLGPGWQGLVCACILGFCTWVVGCRSDVHIRIRVLLTGC